LADWGQIEERFLTVIDPYRAWSENADLFLSTKGQPQLIPIPSCYGVPVGHAPLSVINTKAFQRLRGVHQLSFCEWFFPGASHTRFEHSLGVFARGQTAIQTLIHDRVFRDIASPSAVRGFLLACLLHDIGHFPFAHLVEQYAASRLWKVKEAKSVASHLENSIQLIEHDEQLRAAIDREWGEEARGEAIRVLTGKSEILSELLDGPIDVDKVDYLTRDALHCGIPYGAGLDVSGLLRSMRATSNGRHLGLERSGVSAAEGLMVLQDQMLADVYWHPTVRGMICMFHAVLAHTVVRDLKKFSELVAELKGCNTEDQAIEKVLLPRIEAIKRAPETASKGIFLERLLSPLLSWEFVEIYVPVSTYHSDRTTASGISVYNSIVLDQSHTEAQGVDPIRWKMVSKLREAFISEIRHRRPGLIIEKMHLVVDVPYGKASRRRLMIMNDATGEDMDITQVSHLKETVFTSPATYLSPVRVYLAPEIFEQVEALWSDIESAAERIFASGDLPDSDDND
jgi:HD superfamily phosphohydrolase